MKRIHIAISMTMVIVIVFTGCSKTADSNFTTPAFSDALLSVEIPEPAPIEEPEPVEIEEIEENIVDDVPLTQEEIDALKATATTDMAKRGIERYESIINTGSWTNPESGTVYTEVIGKPGDTSWRRMTDEEARAALEKNPDDWIAEAELSPEEYNVHYGGKIYFDPYAYQEAMQQARQEDSSHIIDSKAKPFELAEPERARELYRDSGYTEEEIDAKFAEIEAWYNQQLQQ